MHKQAYPWQFLQSPVKQNPSCKTRGILFNGVLAILHKVICAIRRKIRNDLVFPPFFIRLYERLNSRKLFTLFYTSEYIHICGKLCKITKIQKNCKFVHIATYFLGCFFPISERQNSKLKSECHFAQEKKLKFIADCASIQNIKKICKILKNGL